jgi:hypothetical protein
MSSPAAFVLGLGLGSLLYPVWELAAALLAHEHPWDRTER